MEREIDLVSLGFQDYSVEDKRKIFMILDIAMKKYHENGYMIKSFMPKDIYYQNGIFGFSEYEHISPINSNDKDEAIYNNIVGLSNLAFCSYLPNYDFSAGLMNIDVLVENYKAYENVFDPIDKEYYRTVLIDSHINKQLPEPKYYYDYVSKKMQGVDLSDRSNGSVRSYVKATEAGRAMADNNKESAFSTTFYLTCMVSAMIIAFIGIGLYFLK